jgi:hypothetical protein
MNAKFVTEGAQLVKQNALKRRKAKPYLLLIFATAHPKRLHGG